MEILSEVSASFLHRNILSLFCTDCHWSVLCVPLNVTLLFLCVSQRYMVLVPDPASGKACPILCDWPSAQGHAAWRQNSERYQERYGESSAQCERRLREHGGPGGGTGRPGLLWGALRRVGLLQEGRDNGLGLSSQATKDLLGVHWGAEPPPAVLRWRGVRIGNATGAHRPHRGTEEAVVTERVRVMTETVTLNRLGVNLFLTKKNMKMYIMFYILMDFYILFKIF